MHIFRRKAQRKSDWKSFILLVILGNGPVDHNIMICRSDSSLESSIGYCESTLCNYTKVPWSKILCVEVVGKAALIRIWTSDLWLNVPMLYQLSYWRCLVWEPWHSSPLTARHCLLASVGYRVCRRILQPMVCPGKVSKSDSSGKISSPPLPKCSSLGKNIQPRPGFEPWRFGLLCWYSTNWATRVPWYENCYTCLYLCLVSINLL